MVKTHPMDKYNGVDVVQKGEKNGQEEEDDSPYDACCTSFDLSSPLY